MKNFLLTLVGIVIALCLSGCSTTRKATATQSEATIKAQATEQSASEQQRTTEVTATNEVKDLTNVLIEFTRIEFDDGSAVTLPEAPATRADSVAQRYREDRSKPPDRGVKAITTGRVLINGDHTEKATTEQTENATSTELTATAAQVEQEESEQTKAEDKPKYGFFDWLYCAIVGGVILAALIFGVRLVLKTRKT